MQSTRTVTRWSVTPWSPGPDAGTQFTSWERPEHPVVLAMMRRRSSAGLPAGADYAALAAASQAVWTNDKA